MFLPRLWRSGGGWTMTITVKIPHTIEMFNIKWVKHWSCCFHKKVKNVKLLTDDARRRTQTNCKKINIDYYKYQMLHTKLNDFYQAIKPILDCNHKICMYKKLTFKMWRKKINKFLIDFRYYFVWRNDCDVTNITSILRLFNAV